MREHQKYKIDIFLRLEMDKLLQRSSLQNYVSYYSCCMKEIEAKKYSNDSDEFVILQLFSSLCSMCFAKNNLQEPFSPLWQIDGRRSCILSDFSEDELRFLEKCLPRIKNTKVRARLADMLWTTNKKEISYAQTAIKEYFTIPITHEEFLHDGFDMWKRGVFLAKKLGNGFIEQVDFAREKLNSSFVDLPHEEDSFGIEIAQLLFELCNSKEIFSSITKKLIQLGESSFFKNNWYEARYLYGEALRWTRHYEREDLGAISELLYRIGLCWETEGAKRKEGFMLSGLAYTDALKIYRQIPKACRSKYNIDEKLLDMQQKMAHANQAMERELTHIKTDGVDISVAVKDAQERIKGKDPLSALVIFANISPPVQKDNLQKQTEDSVKQSTLASIIPSKYYAKDGRLVAISPGISNDINSSESQATLHCQLIQLYALHTSIVVLSSIRPALDIFNSEQLITETDLLQLCSNSPMIPEDRIELWAKGLFYGFKEQYIEAIHLLTPQLENLIRQLLKSYGVKTSIVDNSGIENEIGLSALLDIPQINGIIPPNVIFEIKALLADQPGPNLRNEIAHGLITAREASGNDAIYFWWFCLRLMINSLPISPEELNL